MRLENKVAIVTGAASGMGAATAKLFAREGAKVAVADITEADGRSVSAAINQSGQNLSFFQTCDIASEEDWQALCDATIKNYGRIDILINNAGVSGSYPDLLSREVWETQMTINATGTFLGLRTVIPHMQANGGGSIVNISSIMGFIGGPDSHPGYSASKGAVRIFTKSAAVRFGPSGVRVNSVHPGYLPPMLNNTNAAGRTSKAAVTPLRRLGEVMDVAYGVLYLASDEASFVTGTELVIDGGYIAQ